MTETQPNLAPAEPLYSAQDVAAALGTSGDRALAYSYFDTLGQPGIVKADADEMIQCIQQQQPWPPDQGQQSQGQSAEQPEGQIEGQPAGQIEAQPAEGGSA
jgi:hypothetical protein